MLKLFKIFVLAFVIVIGYLMLVIYWTGYMSSDLEKADVAVVFGAAQYDGLPSPVFKARLDHAKKLYDNKIVKKIIVTGGKGRESDYTTEGRVGRNYLVDLGIDANDIKFEEQSHTTQENLFELEKILNKEKLKSVIFVSDRFHMFRIAEMAKKYNFDFQLSPTDTSPIEMNRGLELKYVWREVQIYLNFLIFHL